MIEEEPDSRPVCDVSATDADCTAVRKDTLLPHNVTPAPVAGPAC